MISRKKLQVSCTLVCNRLFRTNGCHSEPALPSTAEVTSKPSGFFEGVEKLLEVWFTSSEPGTEGSDLRNIPRYC